MGGDGDDQKILKIFQQSGLSSLFPLPQMLASSLQHPSISLCSTTTQLQTSTIVEVQESKECASSVLELFKQDIEKLIQPSVHDMSTPLVKKKRQRQEGATPARSHRKKPRKDFQMTPSRLVKMTSAEVTEKLISLLEDLSLEFQTFAPDEPCLKLLQELAVPSAPTSLIFTAETSSRLADMLSSGVDSFKSGKIGAELFGPVLTVLSSSFEHAEYLCSLKQLIDGSESNLKLPDLLDNAQIYMNIIRIGLSLFRLQNASDDLKFVSNTDLLDMVNILRLIINDIINVVMNCNSESEDGSGLLTLFKEFTENPKMKEGIIELCMNTSHTILELQTLIDNNQGIFLNFDEFVITLTFSCLPSIVAELKPPRTGSDPAQPPFGYLSPIYNQIQYYCMKIICWIFQHYESQRFFLIDEVLSSLVKLPSIQFASAPKNHSAIDKIDSKFQDFGIAWGRQEISRKNPLYLHYLKDGNHVHICSAMLLLFIQSSIENEYRKFRDSMKQDAVIGDNEIDFRTKLAAFQKSAMESSFSIANYMFSFLLKKAISRSSTNEEIRNGGSEMTSISEYKMVLDGVLGDFINVLGSPEYPAAIILLHVAFNHMLDIVEKRGFKVSEDKIDKCSVAGINSLVEMLSWIMGKVRYTSFSSSPSDSNQLEEEFWSPPETNSQEKTNKLVDIFSYLNSYENDGSEMTSSKISHLLFATKNNIVQVNDIQDVELLLKLDTDNMKRIDRENVTNFCKEFISNETLFSENVYKIFLATVVQLLDDINVSLRIRALKSLYLLIQIDQTLMERDLIQSALAKRTLDQSSSVRESALEILSKITIREPEHLVETIYPIVSARILDTSVAVRKRVIRIFKDYLDDFTSNNERDTLIDMSKKLLGRVLSDEESTVKELAIKLLADFWFPNIDSIGNTAIMTKINAEAEKITEYLESIDFENFNAHDSHLLKLSFDTICHSIESVTMPTSVFSSIMTSANVQTYWSRVGILQAYVDMTFQNHDNNLHVLVLFAKLVPYCLVGHMETLCQMLKQSSLSNSDTDRENLYQTIEILNYVLPCFETSSEAVDVLIYGGVSFNMAVIAQTQSLLAELSTKQTSQITESAIQCLCTIVTKLTHNDVMVIKMMCQCLDYALIFQTKMKTNPQMISSMYTSLIRALFIAGLIFKNYNFFIQFAETAGNSGSATMQAISAGRIIDHGYEILHFYSTHELIPQVVKITAITAIGNLWTLKSSLLIDPKSTEIMDKALNDESSNDDMKMQLLNVLATYLQTNEEKFASRKTKKGDLKNDHDLLQGQTLENTESGISGSLMQQYLPSVLKLSLSSHRGLRESCWKILDIVLNSGLIHPLQCIPHLIALETVESGDFRDAVASLHRELAEKFSSFIHNRNMDGCRLAYQTLMNSPESDLIRGYEITTPRKTPHTGVDVFLKESKLKHLYSLVREKKTKRKEFLSQSCSVFELELLGPLSTEENIKKIGFAKFMAEGMAYLDFKTAEEPLLIVYRLSKIISVTGLEIKDMFEKIKQTKNFDSHIPKESITASILIIIAVHLKLYLQKVFKISDQYLIIFGRNKLTFRRVSNFSEGDSSKANDRPATRMGVIDLKFHSVYADDPHSSTTLFADDLKKESHEQLIDEYLKCFDELEETVSQGEEFPSSKKLKEGDEFTTPVIKSNKKTKKERKTPKSTTPKIMDKRKSGRQTKKVAYEESESD